MQSILRSSDFECEVATFGVARTLLVLMQPNLEYRLKPTAKQLPARSEVACKELALVQPDLGYWLESRRRVASVARRKTQLFVKR